MDYKIIEMDLGGVNSYLIKTDNNFILIDTGGYTIMDKTLTNRRDTLENLLEKHGCNSDNLDLIILTHGDYDHSANALYLSKKYNAKIAMHTDDIDLVKSANIDLVMKSFNFRSIVFRIISKLIIKLIRKTSIKILENFEYFIPDILLDENYNLEKYNLSATIIHLPGHTDGSIGILFSGGNFFCGDIFTNLKKPDFAPNAFNFIKFENSLKKLKNYEIKKVFPGHGKSFFYSEL